MFADLPEQIQEQTHKANQQFKQDLSYPSLRFKKVHAELSSILHELTKTYRAVGQLDEDTVIWFWVGSHAEYNILLEQL
ncbi:MAG: hypothetical protein V7L29_32025 [Nostoc sp.]|uniref:ParE family toxin-like protein n=1 Tax=Nostoc sp. TaxID=1180 RepID=UPI002FF46983